MKKVTKKDIERVRASLEEARAQGDDKRISFLTATLERYEKQIHEKQKRTSKKEIARLEAELEKARRAGDAKKVTFYEATLSLKN